MNLGLTDFKQRWDSDFFWPFDSGGGAVAQGEIIDVGTGQVEWDVGAAVPTADAGS